MAGRKQKLLGILMDRNLKFDYSMMPQCKKADRKLREIKRISNLMTSHGRKNTIQAFIDSHVWYSPLVSSGALSVTYNKNVSLFGDLLKKDRSVAFY